VAGQRGALRGLTEIGGHRVQRQQGFGQLTSDNQADRPLPEFV
jgi:hypothetical protein